MKKQIHKRLPKDFVEDVIRTFCEEKIGREQACELLGLSKAQFYQLREKYLVFKKKGEEFKLYNRENKPTRFFPKEVQDFLHEELYYITRCEGRFKNKFNFSFLAEQAEKKFARSFSRNSIRRFALRHAYYHAKPSEKKKVYIRFETPGPGFLFQHDTSHHIWLPLTNSFSDLILTKDDYSRKVVGRRLIEKETSFHHLLTVETTIEEHGLPLSYYVDEHSIFRFVKHKGIHVTYTVGEDEGKIQFKRALESLGIGVIYAHSPEAKGKIEKQFDYFQRRLPFLCQKYKVKKISEAEKVLDELISFYNEKHCHEETHETPNERYNKGIREGKSRLRPLSEEIDLDYVFSLHYQRKVKKDETISFGGERWKVGKFPKDRVTVCFIPKKKIMIFKDKQKLREYHL